MNRLVSIIWCYTDTRENRILKTVNRIEGEAVHQFEAFKLVFSELKSAVVVFKLFKIIKLGLK